MNRRNKRRLIVLVSVVGIVLLAGVGGTALRKINRERIAQTARAEGMAAYEQGDYVTSNRRLRVYLRYDRQDPEVLFALGDARRNVPEPNAKHLLEARTILDEAVAYDPENTRAREILLDIHMQLGQWQELAQTATALLERDPGNLYAARLRVEANLQRGASAEAVEAARAVLAIQEGAIDAHLEMVSTLSRIGRSPREIRAYVQDEVAPQHEGSTGLEVIRAGIEFDFGQRDRAVAMLQQAGQSGPTDGVGARLLLEAIEQVAAATRNPDLYERSQQDWLTSWLEDEALAPHLYEVAAGRAWREGDPQRAMDFANRAIGNENVSEAVFAWGILGAIELRRPEDADRLRAAFDAAIDQYTRARADNWRIAIESFERWRTGQAVAQDAARAAESITAPRSFEGVALYADAMRLAESDSYMESATRLRYLGEQPSWRRARLSEASVHMGNNQPGRAVAVIRGDRVLEASGTGLMLLADSIATIAEQTGDAELINIEQVNAALAEQPDNPLLLAIAGRAELVRGNAERAVEFGQRLASAEAAQAALSAVRFAQGLADVNAPLASAIIDRVVQTGQSPQDVAVAAAAMAGLGRAEDARNLIEARAQGATGPDAQAWTFARIQLANTIDDAQSLIDLAQLSEANASNPRVQREILAGGRVWTDPALTSEVIVRLREAQGEASIDWRVFEARRLLADESSTEAARNATALFEPVFRSETGRRDTQIMLLAARAFERSGNEQSRLEALTFAADGDDPAVALPRLIAVLQDTGRSDAAAQRLRQFVELGQLSPALMRVRQQLLERQGMTDLARRDIAALAAAGDAQYVLRNGVMTRPRDSRTPLTEAEELALSADLSPQGQVYAAELLARVGRLDDGLARLEALPEQSDAGTRIILIARFLNDNGRLDEAIALLRDRAEQDGSADAWMEAARLLVGAQRLDDATALLVEAQAAMPGNTAIDNFAASLAGGEEGQTFDRMALFTISAGQRADAAEGLRELAQVCRRYIDQQITLTQAAGDLETIAATRATLYPVWPLLMAAYEQAGNNDLVTRTARAALNALPADHRVARDAVRVFMRLGQYQEAVGLAGTWLSLAPDADSRAQAQIALGMCEFYRGNPQRAASLLQPHTSLLMADVGVHAPAIRVLTEALVATDRMDDAGAILESLAQSDTQWAAFMASIATAAPTTPENVRRAQRWLEMVTPQLTTDKLGAAYLASAWMSLHAVTDDTTFASRAVEVVRTASASGADSWELQATLATASDALGDYQDAVAAYERALQMSGERIPALLNNAAWIYTTQLRQHDKAVAMAQQAVDAARSAGAPPAVRAIFFHTLGMSQLGQGDPQTALATFDAGLALSETPSLRLGRIEALMAANRQSQARAELNRLQPSGTWSESNTQRHAKLKQILGPG